MLKYALLGFLSYNSMTGYDLKQCLDNSTQFFWQAEQSQIYRTLKELEDKGLVVSHVEQQEDRPDKRIYTLTEAGLADFRNWLITPIQEISLHKRDAFVLKVFFSGDENKADLRMQLLLHRRLHQQQAAFYVNEVEAYIQQALQSTPNLEPNVRFWKATRRFGELYAAAYIQWIDEILALLNSPE